MKRWICLHILLCVSIEVLSTIKIENIVLVHSSKSDIEKEVELNKNKWKIPLIPAADVDSKNKKKYTTLNWAAQKDHDGTFNYSGHQGIVKFSVENGRKGPRPIVQLLFEKTADVDASNDVKNTTLKLADEYGDDEEVELNKNDGNVDAKYTHKNTSLVSAAENGNQTQIEPLLENSKGYNALQWDAGKDHEGTFIYSGSRGIVKLTVENGPTGHHGIVQLGNEMKNETNINTKMNNNIDTALLWAARNGNQTLVESLIKNGADVNARTKSDNTALIMAAFNGHQEVVKLLLENGADINAKTEHMDTALLLAVFTGRQGISEMLIESGADVNARNEYNDTALFHAARNGNQRTVDLLLKNGADANARTKDNNTPLILATLEGHQEVVELLVKHCVDIDVIGGEGKTARDLAIREGYTKIAESINDDCIPKCGADAINGISFVATACSLNKTKKKCSDPAKPGTIAHIKCRAQYTREESEQIISCGENGTWSSFPEACSPICGELSSRRTGLAVGSSYTDITQSPWHVGIYKIDGKSYKLQCGGTILNARVVLSAMLCFWDPTQGKPYDVSLFRIAAGKEKNAYKSLETFSDQKFEVERIHYRRFADIVMIVLKTQIEFKFYISPICLPFGEKWLDDRDNHPTEKGRVPGWGLTRSGGKLSSRLKAVELSAITRAQCFNESDFIFRLSVTQDKFCAGDVNSTISLCEGDAGGGLVFPSLQNGRVTWYIRGIASTGASKFGTHSCDSNKYSTFTNVLYYGEFIRIYEEMYRPRIY